MLRAPLPRPPHQLLHCGLIRTVKKVQFPRIAPLVSALHPPHVLGFTALWEGTASVLPEHGDVGTGRTQALWRLGSKKGMRPRVRGLLEFADVDSFLLRIAEMLGGSRK